MKTIDTLVEDIYGLFDDKQHHEPSDDNLRSMADNIVALVRRRLSEREEQRDPLRFSNLGKPDRQLWYDANTPDLGERFLAKTQFKFLYGDVIEQLLVFLAKEAGHDVKDEQLEIEVDGVKGHLDAVIDGVTVDVKSASPYSFKKFKYGDLYEDDPFGYIQQITGYGSVVTPDTGAAFLVADKVHGDVAILKVDPDTVQLNEPQKRITHLKEVIAAPEPPARCYEPVPEGKSGNMKLAMNCSYCAHKFHCWADANGGRGLRKFNYSSGPVFLTHVEKEPKVPEDF